MFSIRFLRKKLSLSYHTTVQIALVILHVCYCPRHKNSIQRSESVQKRLAKMVKGREKQPRAPGLLELGEEKAEGRPHLTLQSPQEEQ